MIAPVLLALVAAPIIAALWVLAWLIGDLLSGQMRAPVQIRSNDDWRR
jgi:hypothetical protein